MHFLLVCSILSATLFQIALSEGCLELDMTCGDYASQPCCPGMVCRKLREGVKFGRCSVSWAEIIKLNSSSTEPVTTTTSSAPFAST
ncbi:unnamed protein product [Hymenolepis diminuta]|nr:unnamed protein product [Hymenolepis diminuta]